MRVPLSWLAEVLPSLNGTPADAVAERLIALGVEVDEIEVTGASDVDGLVVGEVLGIEELAGFKKPIRYCQVEVAPGDVRGIVCGATNFAVGDRVVVAVPGALLPGDFRITARETYGRTSEGMICSARELGLGDEHSGIMVLPDGTPVGADAVAILGLHDAVLVTEPTPDRGYQLSVRGLARELAAAAGEDYVDPAAIEAPPAGDGFPIVLDDAACDRFCARILRGVDASQPSPLWMQTRLTRAAMRPISLAVDVTNYVNLLLGQPMHAYDVAKLSAPITVRKARAGERLRTLDGVDRKLAAGDDLLITDAAGIQGIAGVMGGAHAEVSEATTDLLLEAAHFDPRTTSRSVRRHGLLSEAGRRFERGVDPELPPVAIELATRLLLAYGGGTADDVMTDVGEPRLPAGVNTGHDRIGTLVGVPYDRDTVVRRLEQLGARVLVEEDGTLEVVPPSWRPDLLETADLAEEVARLEGYDGIPSVLPPAPAGRGLTRVQRKRRELARALAYAGYVENRSFPFHSAEVLDSLGVPAGDARRRLVPLANPLSAEQGFMRTTLLPGLLAALVRNVGRGAEDVALYESGLVFREPADGPRPPAPVLPGARRPSGAELAALDAALPEQPEHLAVVLAGAAEPSGWWGSGRAASWADAVDAVRISLEAAGTPYELRAAERAPWHPGRCAEVVVDGRVVGHAGELHPQVCEALGLPRRTAAAELDLSAVLAASHEEATAPSVSAFPPATQDVALVVDSARPAAEVEAALRAGAGELLEDVRLFDVFTGPQVGEGRKSLAYTLRFRAPDRTLTVEETTVAREGAVESAISAVDAVQRA
ncbi:MAG TPA: phenylalanine--tRNA ligase subunit beta [Mycobacteriales bacterium]|jgi:phenylalanyl-tRNA synthetase beta chain|nr:phenylalanine--tRNA ligase subunit beta [Mycobacteriales bacterium]